MSATRAPCPNCQLPYYTDRNDSCPYCGATGSKSAAAESGGPEASGGGADTKPAGSVRRPTPPSRPRETCQECGLPYYADDADGCPYCDTAGVRGTGATADSGPAARDTGAGEPTASPGSAESDTRARAGNDRSGGLVSRILGLLGR